MASGSPFPFAPQGKGALPPYERLVEEHESGPAPRLPAGATVVQMQPQVYVTPPRDHLAWSLFSTLYMNVCCLGFMALVFSVKARDRKMVGDLSGAGSYGSTAKCLNITALLLNLLAIIILIILITSGVIALAHGPQ